MRGMLLLFVSLLFAACIPAEMAKSQTVIVPRTAKTTLEKTTVTVKDAQGNVMRIEEKEMVLQEYEAATPVEMKQAKSPPLGDIKVERTTTSPTTSMRGRGR